MPTESHTHLCPVCGMPCPEGLAHCSLRCEEQDPVPELGELLDTIYPAPVEGASDGDD